MPELQSLHGINRFVLGNRNQLGGSIDLPCGEQYSRALNSKLQFTFHNDVSNLPKSNAQAHAGTLRRKSYVHTLMCRSDIELWMERTLKLRTLVLACCAGRERLPDYTGLATARFI